MKKLFFLLIIFNHYSFGQTYSVKKDSLLSFLITHKGSYGDINILDTKSQSYLPIMIGRVNKIQKLIKNGKGLYILIDGTGQVYKDNGSNKDDINFTRVDSTIYFGHNYGSIKFSYLDTIYSFGGNGYWHFFGHLIYFNENREWEIKKINEEYIVNSSISYFNSNNADLYYLQYPYKEVSTFKSNNELKLYKLNIKTSKNDFIGYIGEGLLKNIKITPFFSSKKLNGTICSYLNDYYLLNFEKNEISRLKNTLLIKALNGIMNSPTEVFFEKDSLIYIASGDIREVKEFDFKLNDFELTDYKIYYKDYTAIYIIITLILGIIILLFIIKFKFIILKIKKIIKKEKFENELQFSEIEKSLIDLLITKLNKDQLSEIEEVNKVLGLAKKTLEVQKKLRTEHIHRINHKFKVNYNVNVDLIERYKTEEDRRFLKYGISKANSIIYKSK